MVKSRGFSLLELLLALTVTLGIGLAGFQLFRQNERVFQNQIESSEVQQNVRAVLFQINDEIRRAGQAVPVYAATYDATATEATTVILNGSDATHLRVRAGFNNISSTIVTDADYSIGGARAVSVASASVFSNALGTSSPHGRFVYVSGTGVNSCWSWVRAELTAINSASNTLTLIPRQLGENCHVAADTVHFSTTQTIDLEEAAAIYLNNGSIWRTTATDMSNPGSPSWSAASEVGRDIAELTFTYYDSADNAVLPQSLSSRNSISRVDTTIRTVSGVVLTIRGYPRNVRIR